MLLGMQCTNWASLQKVYYSSIPNCMKTGISWASKLQFELWTFLFFWDMWNHRQDIKNQQPTTDDLVLQREVREAALDELRTGQQSLPPLYYIYFTISRTKLLEKSATDVRAWLRLVRGAREADNVFTPDLFSKNGPHRLWLGLPRRTAPATGCLAILLRPGHEVSTDFAL